MILDEIDKLGNVTPIKTKVLHEQMDTAYEHNGQVIAISNRSPDWLNSEWDEEVAFPILHRCGGGSAAHTVQSKK